MKTGFVEIERVVLGMDSTGPLTPELISVAAQYLAREDPHFDLILKQHGPPPLWARRTGFATLIRIILEQQVSLVSAASMYRRLTSNVIPFTPHRFVELGEAYLRSLGLTRQKSAYCVHLARSIIDGQLNLRRIRTLNDLEAREELMRINGIGTWSADVYLLMALRRPDIWPSGDVALITAVTSLKALKARPNPEQLLKLAEPWRPFRAVAARMLWQYYLARRSRTGILAGPL
ncbi:MAG: DNA-3-methyladenine glycosylase [Blastocatellia bacterium]|jgi:DNA-3-methyladenine glycosylase II|nr:DNA-3-methyladenine glycosylase [Blastocatellia bacterium]